MCIRDRHDGLGLVLPGRPEKILALVAQARVARRAWGYPALLWCDGVAVQLDPCQSWEAWEVKA